MFCQSGVVNVLDSRFVISHVHLLYKVCVLQLVKCLSESISYLISGTNPFNLDLAFGNGFTDVVVPSVNMLGATINPIGSLGDGDGWYVVYQAGHLSLCRV